MRFCEAVAPDKGNVKVELVTAADSDFETTELSAKFEELQNNLIQGRVLFTYSFDSNLHDRWIESNTGWRIILGRGLDIFQKPDGKFSLGITDQTKRGCKATTITYVRMNEK